MFTISRSQIAALDGAALSLYIDRLADLMWQPQFANGVSRLGADPASRGSVRGLARRLLDGAAQLGIEAEGDVTPFVLLAVCTEPAYTESGIRPWVVAHLEATEYSAEERLDAVYALLPSTVRDRVFVNVPRD